MANSTRSDGKRSGFSFAKAKQEAREKAAREQAAREKAARGEVRVPEDCPTINEAYARIEQSNGALTTIVLGPGDHVVKGGGYLNIKCPVKIVGSRDVLDKSKIVVVGVFNITANGVHVEHLTIRHKNNC